LLFKNQWRIFGSKRCEIIGGLRKLLDELHTLYPSPNIIRMIQVKEVEMGRERSMHGSEEECMQGFSGKARRKRALGRPRSRWEGSLKTDLR
jgi:hypothetical protein